MKATKLIFLIAIITAVFFVANIILLNLFIPNENSKSNIGSSPGFLTSNESITLTLSEVAKHNSINDCWTAINNKVYDLTSYVNSHPGGKGEIEKGCGKDATNLYDTRGGQGSHSSSAQSMLSSFYIGELNQQIESSVFKNKIAELKNATIPKTEDDYEDEDEYEDD